MINKEFCKKKGLIITDVWNYDERANGRREMRKWLKRIIIQFL